MSSPKTRVDGKSASARVKRWVHPQVQDLTAYHVPSPGRVIKLDAMENPYDLPPRMREQWLQRLCEVAVNRYPDAAAEAVRTVIRESMKVPAEMGLVLGNGSDELIQMIQLCVAGTGRTVLAPTPSFVMYEMIARFVGAEFVGVPLKSDFSLDLPAMRDAIADHDPAVLFLAYPNNPTGNLFDRDAIDQLVTSCDGLVVIDEAYHSFAGASYYSELGHNDNLLVMRTLSKLGLAGLRLGFLIGPGAWTDEFEKVRLPYNINALTQKSVEFALEQLPLFQRQADEIVVERTRMYAELEQVPGISPYPSDANFILFACRDHDAQQIFDHLLHRGVLIKNLHPAGGLLEHCLRVTVGTPEENDSFLAALRDRARLS